MEYETPEADVAEQLRQAQADPDDEQDELEPEEIPFDADAADLVEQSRTIPEDDEEHDAG